MRPNLKSIGLIVSLSACLATLVTGGLVEDKYSCPHGWTRYGNKKCLKYVNELQDYERAQATCRSKNQGTLVTIHSHDEQNFVYSYIHSIAASSTPIWLGAKQPTQPTDLANETGTSSSSSSSSNGNDQKSTNQLVAVILSPKPAPKLRLNFKFPTNSTAAAGAATSNGTTTATLHLDGPLQSSHRQQIDFESILWLDKTENTYTNWAASEPSHPDEICIAINPRTGLWHDVMCTEANVPACERAPTTQWPFFVAFCSEGWFQFNDEKCVRIISSQALNFYESQELCRSKYNSKLLSIKTDKESEFVHNLIKFRDVKLPVWLGAVQNDFSSFNWIDKSDVTFTNWHEGEPNDPDHACLSMQASGGKWSDNDCKEQKLILCQKVPEDSSCETGWLQFRQDKCYRFVHIRLAFDDAESLCNNLYGGHLPSIHSQEEQFMISQFLASVNVKNGSEIWLGGRQMDFHNFNWGDGSQFNYSYWEHGEPNFPAEKCIEMSWRNGRWNDINCRLKRAVLCERQVTSRHLSKPNLYQPTTCLESNCSNSVGGGPSVVQSGGNLPFGVADSFASGPTSGLESAPASDQPIQLSAPVSAATLSATTNATDSAPPANNNQTKSSEIEPAPPLEESKPIKVIASIMHREHSLVSLDLPAPLSSPFNNNNSAAESNNPQHANGTGNFIHYNLPPPEQVNSPSNLATQTSSSSSAAAASSSDQEPAKSHIVAAPQAPVAGQAVGSQNSHSEQQSQVAGSLLNKLRLPVIEADVGSRASQQESLLNMVANSTASLRVAAASNQQQEQLVGKIDNLDNATKPLDGAAKPLAPKEEQKGAPAAGVAAKTSTSVAQETNESGSKQM